MCPAWKFVQNVIGLRISRIRHQASKEQQGITCKDGPQETLLR